MSVPRYMVFVSTVVKNERGFLMVQEGGNIYGQLGTWNFPAGKVETGEDLVSAAVRECKEESGYEVQVDSLLKISKIDFPDLIAVVFYFVGFVKNNTPSAKGDDILDTKFVSIEDMANMNMRFPDLIPLANLYDEGIRYSLELIKEVVVGNMIGKEKTGETNE